MHAANGGHTGAVQALVDANAPERAAVDLVDRDGWTALMHAAAYGRAAAVQVLMGASAALNTQDGNGWTALMHAADRGHMDAVRALAPLAGPIADLESVCINKNRTALMLAAHKGHANTVRTLVEAGANLQATDRHGKTALALAAIKQHIAAVRVLAGPDLAVSTQCAC